MAVSCREDLKQTQRDHDEHNYTIQTGTNEVGCDSVSAERFRGVPQREKILIVQSKINQSKLFLFLIYE